MRQSMDRYYRGIMSGKHALGETPLEIATARKRIVEGMESEVEARPHEAACTLKARLYDLLAEESLPVLFPDCPFFYEIGMRPAESWGTPNNPAEFPASWLLDHEKHRMRTREMGLVEAFANGGSGPWIWNHYGGGFDWDHHCLGYSRLLREGLGQTLTRIQTRLEEAATVPERLELDAMLAGGRALIRIAERFAEMAEAASHNETNPEALADLARIAETARHIPANPPRTFYEGLAMLLFLREVTASLESIGISVLGHPDRQLIGLYRADLRSGRLTEAEARRLIAAWMIPHDIKTFARERAWPETSTCVTLGGCDETGKPVFNELTRLFIEVHHDQALLNPKLNCRYDRQSPAEYLELVAGEVLAGCNHFALLNDEVLIEAAIRMGKSPEQARLYVNGGCQEPMCEGIEHTAGAFYYFNMAQIMHLAFTGRKTDLRHLAPEQLALLPDAIEANDFETFYATFMAGLKTTIAGGAAWGLTAGIQAPKVNPCPLFSTTLEGCIDKGKDYTAGGALFNSSGVSLVGLGEVVNSLLAVKTSVYDEAWISLADLREQVQTEWPNEALRQRIQGLPRFGQGNPEADQLAERFCREIAGFVKSIPNERGETFQPSFFVYYMFKTMGDQTGATPDGRRHGEILSQGIAPSRVRAPQSLTQVFQSVRAIDFAEFPGNCVLDVQLPAGGKLPRKDLAALIRTFACVGGPTLQLNCVSPDILKQAQENPRDHADLTVRISGLSACFVNLKSDVQDEIIQRAMITC
jgi:formate C-acetyltransferase